jgi:putative redox protein
LHADVADQIDMSKQIITREKLTFTNQHGEELAGLLELPEAEPLAYALFAHCFTCSKHIGAASRVSRALASRGVGVLRFDFTGLGNSEGDFANTNFTSNVQDLVSAASAIQQRFRAPDLLIGHSLGGAAVLVAASQLPNIRGVVTIAAPSDPAHVTHLFARHHQAIHEEGFAEVNLAGRQFTITRQFLEDITEQSLLGDLRAMHKALLVMHSPNDEIVEIEHARHIFEAANYPKSFHSLDGADHLLSQPEDADYAAEVITTWAGRYIVGPDKELKA